MIITRDSEVIMFSPFILVYTHTRYDNGGVITMPVHNHLINGLISNKSISNAYDFFFITYISNKFNC